jgi:hypothetical protein
LKKRSGRAGGLSLRALKDFTLWFLKVSIDQVNLMSDLFEIDALAQRFKKYVAQSETLKAEIFAPSGRGIGAGKFDRREVSRITVYQSAQLGLY